MKPHLPIDFGPPVWRLPPAGVALLLLAGILLAAGGIQLWHAYQANDHARAELEQAMRIGAASRRVVPAAANPAARQAEKQSQAIVRALTVPWQDLLSIVENYPERDVALIGIDQNPAQSQIRIVAEAKDADAMVAYLKYLQGSKLLREPVLNAHLIENNVPGTPVRFQIAAVWRKP